MVEMVKIVTVMVTIGEDVDSEERKWLDFAPKWFHVGAETDSEWCQASCWSPPPFVLSPHLFRWNTTQSVKFVQVFFTVNAKTTHKKYSSTQT